MTDESLAGTAKGADAYVRRHPAAAKTNDEQQTTGSAAGRSAYERRHGTRPHQNG